MLKRKEIPRINIPGMEIKVKLNSNEVAKEEAKELFEATIAHLISELSKDKFRLAANITEDNSFIISISKLPSSDMPSYRINIDIGVFRWIYDALYIVLSNNDNFAGYGRAYGKFNIPTLEVPNWNVLDLAMANCDEDVLFDFARMDLHNFLYNVCLSFIIRHEIRHIANGHIGYILSKNQPLFFENSKNGLNALDSQTLEMDVDSCVFAGFLEGFLNDPKQQSLMPEEFRNTKGIMATCLFCIQFLFYCLPSRKISSYQEAIESSHPNAFMRFFNCYTTGLSLLQDKYPSALVDYKEIYENNFKIFINNLGSQGLIDIDRVIKDYEWTLSEEGMSHADNVWNNWNNWIPKLENYAFLQLAPPIKQDNK